MAERWLSGLRHTPGKRAWLKPTEGSNPSLSASTVSGTKRCSLRTSPHFSPLDRMVNIPSAVLEASAAARSGRAAAGLRHSRAPIRGEVQASLTPAMNANVKRAERRGCGVNTALPSLAERPVQADILDEPGQRWPRDLWFFCFAGSRLLIISFPSSSQS